MRAVLLPVLVVLGAWVLVSCSTPPAGAVQWSQVKQNPATYHPAGFVHESGAPLPQGNWVSDEAGRARFFVPASGAGGYTAAQLRADAIARAYPGSLPPDSNRGRVSVGMGVGVGGWSGGSGGRAGIGIGGW